MSDLEKKLHNELMDNYEAAKKELGYNAAYFLQMISEKGGYETALHLIRTVNPSQGFTTLWENERLDLSLEATCLKEEYAELFTEDDKQKCKERLLAHGFRV